MSMASRTIGVGSSGRQRLSGGGLEAEVAFDVLDEGIAKVRGSIVEEEVVDEMVMGRPALGEFLAELEAKRGELALGDVGREIVVLEAWADHKEVEATTSSADLKIVVVSHVFDDLMVGGKRFVEPDCWLESAGAVQEILQCFTHGLVPARGRNRLILPEINFFQVHAKEIGHHELPGRSESTDGKAEHSGEDAGDMGLTIVLLVTNRDQHDVFSGGALGRSGTRDVEGITRTVSNVNLACLM